MNQIFSNSEYYFNANKDNCIKYGSVQFGIGQLQNIYSQLPRNDCSVCWGASIFVYCTC